MGLGHTWALVLAAGEGSRLRSVTTTRGGDSVPKQFCCLRGGASFLHEALRRAEAVAPPERICTIVAEGHRRWWQNSLQSLPSANVIVQPRNRGTANGILLPLLHILERDPEADVVLLPSDHHVSDERVLARSMRAAVQNLKHCKRELLLLGFEPDEADAELGYIVPGQTDAFGLRHVVRFAEKPSAHEASELILQGALWNAFIVVAKAQALLATFAGRYPNIVSDLQAVVAHDAGDPQQPKAASHAYRFLPELDFSRHVVQGLESGLRVVAVPSCGWSDLGTPKRVAETLRRAATDRVEPGILNLSPRGYVNLAERFA